MAGCLDALREDLRSKSMSDQEVEELFNEAKKLWEQVQAGPNAAKMQQEAARLGALKAKREKIAAALKKRNVFLQLERKAALMENSLINWKGREAEGLSAMIAGNERVRKGSRYSVDSLSGAIIRNEYLGGLLTDIEALGKTHLKIFNSGSMDREIAIAMSHLDDPAGTGPGIPKEAVEIAEVAHKWMEKARINQNRVGGYINKLPGYVAFQSHDMMRIRKEGFEQWRADIEERLDWTRTAAGAFDPARNPKMTAKDKAKNRTNFLHNVYLSLASGVHIKAQGSANPLASALEMGSLASRISHERILHFMDGEAWFEYNAKYGARNLRDAIMNGLSHAAGNTALMRMFGPSPQENLEAVSRDILLFLKKAGDLKAVDRFKKMQRCLDNEMKEVDNSINIPGSPSMAAVARNTRALISMSKLGGAVISGFSDIPTFAVEMAYQGKSLFGSLARAMVNMAKGRGSLEQRRILSSLGVYMDAMCGGIASRFGDADFSGKMSAAMRMYFKANLLSWWTDTHKASAGLMMAHDMALIKDLSFDQIKPQERRLLSLYGIDAEQWDMLRRGNMAMADGREYLTPDAAYDVTDDEIKSYLANQGKRVTSLRLQNFREELADRLRTLYKDRVQYAVLEPDARTNALLHQGQEVGTALGEALRFISQFKSFPVVFMQRAMGRELYGRGADSWWRGAVRYHGEMSNLGLLIALTTVFGYVSMTAKQLIAGKTPRGFTDEKGNFDAKMAWKTICAAAVQGGGMGIYGDFIFGEKSRMGNSLPATLAGPAIGIAGNAISVLQDFREGEFGEGPQANAARLMINNIPGNNLFYVRAALDYTILNSFYEWLNPGYLRRMRRRIEKENNQTFYRQPTVWQ